MLVQKLNYADLNNQAMTASSFDGTMVYAQNKRQQVAKFFNLNIFFTFSFFKNLIAKYFK